MRMCMCMSTCMYCHAMHACRRRGVYREADALRATRDEHVLRGEVAIDGVRDLVGGLEWGDHGGVALRRESGEPVPELGRAEEPLDGGRAGGHDGEAVREA